ncbi:ATP-binding cassette domain-containing protein [Pannonibacter sp. Pt2-lr]
MHFKQTANCILPQQGPTAVRIRDLSVSYGGKPALLGIAADVQAASMTAIIGPNGAGKSTLLKAALGIVPCLSGTVDMFGQPLRRFASVSLMCRSGRPSIGTFRHVPRTL